MNEIQIKKLLGVKIRGLRRMKNLSQFALGEIIEINQRQVALIETGKSFPSLKTLCGLCKVFNCTLSDSFSFDIGRDTAKIHNYGARRLRYYTRQRFIEKNIDKAPNGKLYSLGVANKKTESKA